MNREKNDEQLTMLWPAPPPPPCLPPRQSPPEHCKADSRPDAPTSRPTVMMTVSKRGKPRWWRPRFSVRVLLVALTLLCAYLACWKPTQDHGPADVVVETGAYRSVVLQGNHAAAAPLIVRADVVEMGGGSFRRYYFWFFGYVARLPYERQVDGRETFGRAFDALTRAT